MFIILILLIFSCIIMVRGSRLSQLSNAQRAEGADGASEGPAQDLRCHGGGEPASRGGGQVVGVAQSRREEAPQEDVNHVQRR